MGSLVPPGIAVGYPSECPIMAGHFYQIHEVSLEASDIFVSLDGHLKGISTFKV